MRFLNYLILSVLFSGFAFAESEYRQIIKENIADAKEHDFVVVAFEKTCTVLHIVKADRNSLILEEITVPKKRLPSTFYGWRDWVLNKAPGHTDWIAYEFEKESGLIKNAFSYVKGTYLNSESSDLFLTTLFNLNFRKIPLAERRKIGAKNAIAPFINPNDIWNPPVVIDGNRIHGIFFNAWKTKWPSDNSYLSGKTIEIYLPSDETAFPSYFPYWLQISGVIGKAKIRIIDTGSNLKPVREWPELLSNSEKITTP